MMKSPLLLIPLVFVTACSGLPFIGGQDGSAFGPAASIDQRPETRPGSGDALAPPAGASTVSALDTTSAEAKAEALATPANTGKEVALGETPVSLGNVTEGGLWLRSALVKTAGPGRVVTASGASLLVDLIPGDGAAQLSLSAFRALGLSLTDLPKVTIFAR
jgi:hypothetical protein